MKKYDIWMADFNPRQGTEPGKIRPVVIVQTNFLNGIHPSTLICPLTTKIQPEATILRVHVNADTAGLPQHSDILVDQIRAIDNRRLVRQAGQLPTPLRPALDENLKIVLDLL